MLNRPKTRRALLLAFLGIALLLSIVAGSLYLMVQSGYGNRAAFLALTIITIVILGLICNGVQYAVAIEKAVREQITTPGTQAQTTTVNEPSRVETFGQILFQPPEGESNIEPHPAEIINKNKNSKSGFQAHKRRGKRSRFSTGKITKAVLTWEQRDSQFTTLTLAEFLEQEFGAGPDGVLLVAPTTFYDWRRRVLRDLELKDKDQSNEEGVETF